MFTGYLGYSSFQVSFSSARVVCGTGLKIPKSRILFAETITIKEEGHCENTGIIKLETISS